MSEADNSASETSKRPANNGDGHGGDGATAAVAGTASAPRSVKVPRATAEREITYSRALDAALEHVLPSDEPLDNPLFSPVDYINQLFTSQQSLGNIEALSSTLRGEIVRLDEEILDAVRKQTEAGTRGRENLGQARRAIAELGSRVAAIKTKAVQSEVMVQEICRDIRSLDYAKQHLTMTITSLEQLDRFIACLASLPEATESRMWSEAGAMLQEMHQLAEALNVYKDHDKIADYLQQFHTLREATKALVFGEFRVLERDPSGAPVQDLAALCGMVDGMGADVRNELISWWTGVVLFEYKQEFRPGIEASQLGNVEQRYAWFKRQLREYPNVFGHVFPDTWAVLAVLAQKFCDITSAQLVDVLHEAQERVTVPELLRALQHSVEFEAGLGVRFASGVSEEEAIAAAEQLEKDHADNAASEEEVSGDEDDANIDPTHQAAREIKRKYREYQRKKRQEERQRAREAARGPGAAPVVATNRFKRVISGVFEPYLYLYVQEEERQMTQVFDRLIENESWCSDGDVTGLKVLGSSTMMIVEFNKAMKRCVSFARSKTLFDLFKMFHRFFNKYAEALEGKVALPANTTATLGTTDWQVKLSDAEVLTLALVINTAQYVSQQCEQLVAAIQRVIEPAFSDSLHIGELQDRFDTIASQGVTRIVLATETRVEPALLAMTKVTWATWEGVGDTSEYIHRLGEAMQTTLAPVGSMLNESKFWFHLCIQFAKSFLSRFLAALYRCKRLSDGAAEHILMDVAALKDTILLKLPGVGTPSDGPKPTPRSFPKYVNSALGKMELMLKVLMAPSEVLADRYNALIPETMQAEADLQQLLELKGVKRSDQASHLSAWRALSPAAKNSDASASDVQAEKPGDIAANLKKLFQFGNTGSSGGGAS